MASRYSGIAVVTLAVAAVADDSQISAHGEMLDLKNTVNNMVLLLRTLAAELTRVTVEVGRQGKVGGRASVPEAQGVWLDLVTNVNRRPVLPSISHLLAQKPPQPP
ncbi:hypothetical protein R3P38DRAFT_2956705 [Favolaschia claudopus]|uniref:Uncharacterized protein n=1 Tax=Favolaschia claudopus TaxID=2862362 RepID=A0AAW0B9S2_9AGAR